MYISVAEPDFQYLWVYGLYREYFVNFFAAYDVIAFIKKKLNKLGQI